MKVHERTKGGIWINQGEQLVIPKDWLKLSLNPLKTNAQLFKPGIKLFAEQIFLERLPNKRDQIIDEVNRTRDEVENILRNSPLLNHINLDTPGADEAIFEILDSNRDSIEWWAYLTGMFYSFIEDAKHTLDFDLAIWAIACAERCKSMLVFKQELEEVVWMGQSARRILDLLAAWDNNQENSSEEFWQNLFTENHFVLSLLFAVPIIFIEEKAYVGGMNLDRSNGRFVDFLFQIESSQEAILIEIKTPTTKILGKKYRQSFVLSSDMSGAIAQVLDYKSHLLKKLESEYGISQKFAIFNPRCVVISGNARKQLETEDQRKAFEIQRDNRRDVEIVTYDEIFRKLEVLASLFSLVRTKKSEPSS